MNVRGKALKGSALLTVGEGLTYGFSFARNMILARLLTKADFGIVATFTMVITLLEFSAKMGIARFIIRDKEGNEPEFVATAHLVQFAVAVLSALIIFAAAPLVALAFGLQGQASSFRALALLPLLQGLVHLDVRRFERDLRFGPSMMAEAIPQGVITLLAWPVAVWLEDYRTVLLLLVIKSLLTLSVAHLYAEQGYSWRFNHSYAMRMLRFGWPLILNGFITFIAVRGDQFIVASFYSMNELGAYAAGAALAVAPTLFFSRVFASVMLPLMSRVQDDRELFAQRFGLVIALISAFSAFYATSLIIASEVLMQLAFGAKYSGAGIVFAGLVAANSFRTIRLAAAISAVAKGDSMNELISNASAGVTLVAAVVLAAHGSPTWIIAASGVMGESLACFVSSRRLSKRDGVPVRKSILPFSSVFGAIAIAILICFFGHPTSIFTTLAVGLLVGFIAAATIVVAHPESRSEVMRVLRRRHSGTVTGLVTPA